LAVWPFLVKLVESVTLFSEQVGIVFEDPSLLFLTPLQFLNQLSLFFDLPLRVLHQLSYPFLP
jgi:hypothetical protein